MNYGESDEHNTDAVQPSQETKSIIETETRQLIDVSEYCSHFIAGCNELW